MEKSELVAHVARQHEVSLVRDQVTIFTAHANLHAPRKGKVTTLAFLRKGGESDWDFIDIVHLRLDPPPPHHPSATDRPWFVKFAFSLGRSIEEGGMWML